MGTRCRSSCGASASFPWVSTDVESCHTRCRRRPPMSLELKRLHLASLRGVDGREWPVHGFVVTHPGGAVLVESGVGGPQEVLDDWRVVNRSVADALAR